MSTGRISDREYENLVREGINAAKAGNRSMARRLLFRAVSQKPNDTLVWLWLSSTTDNPQERREMLEKAVAADPNNEAARIGLAHLNELGDDVGIDDPRIPSPANQSTVIHENNHVSPAAAASHSFDCPVCGGRMSFEPWSGNLLCESCGSRRALPQENAAESAETPIVGMMHRADAHAWASATHEVVCEQCGAHTLEDQPGQTHQCPYCGSNQFIESEQLETLIEPQAIVIFRVQSRQAEKSARNWLNTGIFAPDGLAEQARRMKLRPAYYPFWIFDGGVEIRWSAEVRENYGRSSYGQPEWRSVEGIANEFFDDVLVSGVSALKRHEINAVEPFQLMDMIAFDTELIAGWPTLAYDRSLADASLLARELVLKRLTPRIRSGVEPGKERRDVRIGAGSWSGVSYKLVLLPLWLGTYHFDGREYHILVNGQTGKVGGQKPHDRLKVVGVWLLIFLSIAVLTLFLTWIFNFIGWF